MRGRLTKLASLTSGAPDSSEPALPDFLQNLPDPDTWTLTDLWPGGPAPVTDSERQLQSEHLEAVLTSCTDEALELSNALSRRYFSHAASASQSLGA